MIKSVYICVVPYHLYLSLLLIGKNKDRSFILLNANNREIYEQFKDVAVRLAKQGFKVDVRLRNKFRDIIGMEGIVSNIQFKRVFDGDKPQDFELYNFAWNCQYVYSTANLFYKKCKRAFFIEEGALTPINPPQPKWKIMVKRLLGASVDFYKDDKLVGIYVQKPDIYPSLWNEKLNVLDVKALIQKMNSLNKQIIIDVFLGDFSKRLKTMFSDTGIVYTQPLSEDGYITEEKKKEYFQQMVNYYGQNKLVFLKIHPRDISNYNVKSNCIILPGFFPSELLNLLGIHFKYAVGICTSAVLNSEADVKLNLNENFLNDKEFCLKPIA